eukprot:gene9128-11597_t
MEAQLAHIGDLLAKDAGSLSPAEKTAVDNFRKDIAQALPIGASEAHRLVQEAVAEYLGFGQAAHCRRAAGDLSMRAAPRGPQAAPACLDQPDKKGLNERDRARAHQQSTDPKKGSFEFAAYKHEEVKRRLDALFHGKCAYCETFYSASAPVDVEHYRPKGAVSENPNHPGYWWLAMSWDNLLPSCIDCNRKRNQRVFLVSSSLSAQYHSSHDSKLPQTQ